MTGPNEVTVEYVGGRLDGERHPLTLVDDDALPPLMIPPPDAWGSAALRKLNGAVYDRRDELEQCATFGGLVWHYDIRPSAVAS